MRKKANTINHSKKSLLMAFLAFLVLLSLYFIRLKEPQIAGASAATMILSFDKQNQRVFRGPVTERMTVLEALISSAQDSNIKLVYYVDEKEKVNLSAIADKIVVDGHGWNFSVNSKPIATGDINKVYVEAGDIIEARYE